MLFHLLKTNPELFYKHPDITGYWYYMVELEPDHYTPGFAFPNLAITRDLLRRTHVSGRRCYDLGTMEGVISTLIAKRGAKKVVSMDGINYSRKVELLKALHNVHFDYHPNIQLDNVASFIRNKARLDGDYLDRYDYRSDVTVAAGMLYHVFSPFHFLGYTRSITREGGIVIIETAVMKRNDFTMQYNFLGDRYLYGWSDTWYPSVPLLDYMLRLCKLRPLDALWVEQSSHPDLIRLGVACRCTSDVIVAEGESLMAASTANIDYNIFVDTFGEAVGRGDVPFEPSEGIKFRADGVTCDLLETILNRAAIQPNPDELRFRLDAMA